MNNNNNSNTNNNEEEEEKESRSLHEALGYISYLQRSVRDLKQEIESIEGPSRTNKEFDEVSSSHQTGGGGGGEEEDDAAREEEEDPSGLLELKVSKVDNCIYSLHIVCSGGVDKVVRAVECMDVEVMSANMTVLPSNSNCYYLVKAVSWDRLSISEIKRTFKGVFLRS